MNWFDAAPIKQFFFEQRPNKGRRKHIECNETKPLYLGFCEIHRRGGVFESGETYEQYQIIEQDFIDFIKIVPLNIEDNHKVYSPVLRDIIIRSCVQIELF